MNSGHLGEIMGFQVSERKDETRLHVTTKSNKRNSRWENTKTLPTLKGVLNLTITALQVYMYLDKVKVIKYKVISFSCLLQFTMDFFFSGGVGGTCPKVLRLVTATCSCDRKTILYIKPASRMVWTDGDPEASPGKRQILSCDQ